MTTEYAAPTRYAWLSIAAAVTTIGLKAGVYLLTGSVGLLADALESVVNLVAAIMALLMLTLAARPPDEDHAYGHNKAEYFSSGFEGALILIAAASISITAVDRLLHPQPITQLGLGLGISLVASAINLVVARILFHAGRHYRSITLEADAQHLMTDVWTSAGVITGIGLVALTGWERLDPIIALIVAANIVWSGVRLMKNSALGLLDTALPVTERTIVQSILNNYHEREGVQYHALRTRQAGTRRFVSVHILVPGEWSVQHGHRLLERIERDMRCALSPVTVFTHLEPLEDPDSWEDVELDRVDPRDTDERRAISSP
ncbi:MAG: cation diffusion facilitator family transporter [Chloroflexales bacterium]|nr:cation diffusion facilitator family transporter [Chloroflexales bacterium]